MSKKPVPAEEAARQVGFNGVIDEAYKIGDALFIVSDDVVHAYGCGKSDNNKQFGTLDTKESGLENSGEEPHHMFTYSYFTDDIIICFSNYEGFDLISCKIEAYTTTEHYLDAYYEYRLLRAEYYKSEVPPTDKIAATEEKMCQMYGILENNRDKAGRYESRIDQIKTDLSMHKIKCAE